MKTYLFNPEHDMALASFSPYYKAPAEIVRMKSDLSTLPVWYAECSSQIHVDSMSIANNFVEQCHLTALKPPVRCVIDWDTDEFSPWGWDPAITYMLAQTMGKASSLPSQSKLERIKYLSGRQRCVQVLNDFWGWSGICGRSMVCSTLQEVKERMKLDSEIVLKAPWSGSGRGLTRTSQHTWNANTEGWVARIIRTQGAVMAEPLYDKVVDFAMEFHINKSGVLAFVGYSLFETDSHGNYKQNLLLSDSQIVSYLTQYVSSELLEKVKNQLLTTLVSVLSDGYDGYFGVDMMICKNENEYSVHPCVEINLRMNMGVVARLLYDRYIVSGVRGHYVVEHYNKDGEALEQDAKFRKLYSADIRDEKMYRGYFPLTPVFANTRYQCYVLLDD